MNQDTRVATNLLTIILATFVCMALAYFLSSNFVGHQLATDSGNMSYSRWQEKFQVLVVIVGAITGLCSFIWFGLAKWIFEINSYEPVSRRPYWAGLLAVTLIVNIVAPQIYSLAAGIKLNVTVTGVFILAFTVIGYWLLSIVVTPPAFKYVPLGGSLLR